jgi:hypothetical protein
MTKVVRMTKENAGELADICRYALAAPDLPASVHDRAVRYLRRFMHIDPADGGLIRFTNAGSSAPPSSSSAPASSGSSDSSSSSAPASSAPASSAPASSAPASSAPASSAPPTLRVQIDLSLITDGGDEEDEL